MSKCGWLALVGVALVLSQAHAGKKVVVKKARVAPQPAVKLLTPVEVVEVVGKMPEADALAKLRVREKVEEQLNKHLGDGRWERRPHQLAHDYLVKKGVVTLENAPPPVPLPPPARQAEGRLVTVRYKVALTKMYEDAVTAQHVVKGFGRTEQAAREQALLHAQEEVERLVQELSRQDGWRLPARLLDPERLQNWGVIVSDAGPMPSPEHNDATCAAYYRVELTPKFREEIQFAVRTELMQDRHPILLRILGGLVVVLLVTTGYLRLEEMTRGYATALLRAAAAAIVLLTALALFLTR